MQQYEISMGAAHSPSFRHMFCRSSSFLKICTRLLKSVELEIVELSRMYRT